ncbi:hypothetical protein C8J57DRAFT_1246714 [Mycena rebaudengoi]|nr:hypothetical protein C8J57DRAFT_1246714 [Mycena rebaudengoi]
MPPPNMGHIQYTLPKIEIPRTCTTHPAPTPENDSLSLAPAKTGNLPSIAHICGAMLPKSWLKRTSIDPSTVQYLIKSENPAGSPSLVIIALVILIILTLDITSFHPAKPLPQTQQVKKPLDHSGDVKQFGLARLSLGPPLIFALVGVVPVPDLLFATPPISDDTRFSKITREPFSRKGE